MESDYLLAWPHLNPDVLHNEGKPVTVPSGVVVEIDGTMFWPFRIWSVVLNDPNGLHLDFSILEASFDRHEIGLDV